MITLMTITMLGTAIALVFRISWLVLRVFGKAFGLILGLVLLVPVLGILLVGAGIVFLPVIAILVIALFGARRIAHLR